MLTKILKTFQRIIIAIFQINFFDLTKYYDTNSKNIIIICPNFPRDILRYFYSDAFINDIALLNGFCLNKIHFRITLKQKNWTNKNIYLNFSKRYSLKNENYSESILKYIYLLSEKNEVFPSYKEALLWENKIFMHNEFNRLDIKDPKTLNFNTENKFVKPNDIKFPLLLKEVHSAGSLGVHKINNEIEANNLLGRLRINPLNKNILIQELLEMDRDLRVILIGNKIVHYYWRINKTKIWRPTSTKHGSDVDFVFFPENWRIHIINEFKKLNISTGAFDIVWENNDYTQKPYFLEVSTSYQPNPIPPPNLKISYGQFKTSFKLFASYEKKFILEVNKEKELLVKEYFKINE